MAHDYTTERNGHDDWDEEAFAAAMIEAEALARAFADGAPPPADPGLLAVARDATARMATRRAEDVQAWADRLAADVGHLTD